MYFYQLFYVVEGFIVNLADTGSVGVFLELVLDDLIRIQPYSHRAATPADSPNPTKTAWTRPLRVFPV